MSGARQGRRRRILQDEVLSASREMAAHDGDESSAPAAGERRRYALSAGSLGNALAQGHFPNRVTAPLVALAGSLLSVGGLAAVHHYRQPVAAALGQHTLALTDATSPTSLAAWATTGSALVVAVLAAMILSVRSRRVDDYKGRHRLWRGAVVAAMLLSLDAATNLHAQVAQSLAQLTGFQLLAGGAEWWLLLGGGALAWIAFRVALDMKESKLAICMFIAAAVAGGVAVVAPLAGLGGLGAAMIAKLAQLTTYLLSATSMVAFTRYLRHDVAAGVASKPQRSRPTDVKLAKSTVSDKPRQGTEEGNQRESNRTAKKKPRQQVAEKSESTQWTDGSDGYNDNYDDEPQTRKLSKSERKRLRQQKADRRAA